MHRFSFSSSPLCPNTVLQTDTFRITLLTSRLLRLETGSFTDLPTQTVWNRDLGPVSFETTRQPSLLTVRTESACFRIQTDPVRVLSVTLPDGTTVSDFTAGNLLGTARTLDNINGPTPLQPGILSRSGASLMEDSASLLLADRGEILPRPACTDRYYFAYGHDYLTQLRDFFRLTGPVPLIPKYALGNWWSRYRAYTQEEYRAVMQTFLDRKIPITVATIDMDWHWTDVLDRFGPDAKPAKPKCREERIYNTFLPGWTGYSWNTELFPDHRELLRWLHDHGFHVTLNVHPSQGIRFFEDRYSSMCRRMGTDPEKKQLIPFDFTDKNYITGYFDDIHHPLESEGVDFWWLDWQQGTKTAVPGLDPLWALNHYHTLDMANGEKRPLILSRYAGLGSHRYPLGFSGDTICTWKSLAFQPYFTANAANAGYTWWSHDIGGHMRGVQDDELYLRWLQFGVFSPINRLHSSSSEYMGKEPWKRSWAVARISETFLRLRHRMIPFLYSANHLTHTQGIPLCMPMYYRYHCDDAYEAKNQYLFGSQLLVCPITQPADRRLNLACTRVWLPQGRWTDIFTGRIYNGGRWVTMYRDLDSIPVLAPEGTIVPMYHHEGSNDLSLDQPLDIHIWHGNGSFSLYEDDGTTNACLRGESAITGFRCEVSGDSLRFTILPPAQSQGLLPQTRTMYLCFRDLTADTYLVDGQPVTPQENRIPILLGTQPVTAQLHGLHTQVNPPAHQAKMDLLTRVQGNNSWKNRQFSRDLEQMPEFIRLALEEISAFSY